MEPGAYERREEFHNFHIWKIRQASGLRNVKHGRTLSRRSIAPLRLGMRLGMRLTSVTERSDRLSEDRELGARL